MSEAFSTYEILDKKRKNQEISAQEIKWFIEEFLSQKIPDYQMSALLMAIAINGASTEETAALTDAMLYSGKVFNFDDHRVIDKHSTGGVGDKTSFILAPIAAACGVKVPMVAGRGLGFTGGTVDKIEAIPGFQTSISNEKFKTLLEETGIVLIGQTEEIAPADKKIYALRDVTATIESIPLITASIMSKKLAEGANGIVMDIKLGNGAFMKEMAQAKSLATSIIQTAKRFGKKATALISNMDEPLGKMIGHSLELIESIDTLKGQGPKDLTELSLDLAAYMILQADLAPSYEEALKMAKDSVQSGKALEKFSELLRNQGADPSILESYESLPIASEKTIVQAPRDGFIQGFSTKDLGYLLIDLGGGRKTKNDKIDFSVGFEVHKKIGEKVSKSDPLLTIYHHDSQREIVEKMKDKISSKIISIVDEKVISPQTIQHRMGDFTNI